MLGGGWGVDLKQKSPMLLRVLPVPIFSPGFESIEYETGAISGVDSAKAPDLVLLLDAESGSEVPLLATEELLLHIVPVQLNALVGDLSHHRGVSFVWEGHR